MKEIKKTVTLKVGDKEFTSKPFDFEALCLINDAHGKGENGAINLGHYALVYLFEGTPVTKEILDTVSIEDRARACMELFNIYAEMLTAISEKN